MFSASINHRLIFGFVTLFCIPLSIQAQTASSTIPAEFLEQQKSTFNIQEYFNQQDVVSNQYFIEQEKSFVDPIKIHQNTIRDNLEVVINPPNPKPRETVTVSIESYSTNLEKATITWVLNGKIIANGPAKKVVSFQNAEAGGKTELLVTIKTNLGVEVKKKISFAPVGVTMLWEARTHTPPFYRGKPLASTQSMIRAIAIPDTLNKTNKSLAPENLVFIWTLNGEPEEERSGYAKNSFLFLAPKPYEDLSLGLSVSSVDDSVKSSMKFNIPLTKPFILFYERHPLLGVWYNRPFGSRLKLSKNELSISAEPFFFSRDMSPQEDPEILYAWKLNGEAIKNPSRFVTFRNETGEEGGASVLLEMRGSTKTSQKGSRSLSIDFKNQNTGLNAF